MKLYFSLVLAFLISTNLYSQFSGGLGTANNPYQITSRADMEALADSVDQGNNWSQGKYFKLINDITDSIRTVIGYEGDEYAEEPIPARYFQGDFNGNNKKITLALDTCRYNNTLRRYIGLFAFVSGADIYDLTVDGYVKSFSSLGGICAYAGNSKIQNCINKANMMGVGNGSGGICGEARNVSFSDCVNYASVEGEGSTFVGGICGLCFFGSIITNCQNSGAINGETCVGGIVGHASPATILYCTNSGTITGNNYGVGGIVGHFIGDTIAYCINIGTIIGKNQTVDYYPAAYSGGIVGMGGFEKAPDDKTISLIHSCINSGLIIGENSTGGIIGYAFPFDKITNSLNTGVVTGNTNPSSIAGEFYYMCEISNCHYDKQMCIHSGRARAGLTKDIIGSNLQGYLGNTDWTFKANLYPTLKHFAKDSIALVAASPVYLYGDNDWDFDIQNKVRTDFKVNLENDVKWNRTTGNVNIVAEDGFVLNDGSDTLIASIGNYKKLVPLNIEWQPIGDINLTLRATEHKQIAPTASDYSIPIYIKSDRNILQEKLIKELIVEIDKDIFYAKRSDNGTIVNKSRNILILENIKMPPLKANEEIVLFNIIGDMLLGNTDSSGIIFNPNIEFAEQLNAWFALKNGHITLDICREDNDRFVENTGNLPSLSIKNNPIEDILEVECNVLESGSYSLEVVDMTGRSVKVEEFVAGEAGNKFYFTLSTENWSVGNYLLVLSTSASKYSAIFTIKR